MKFQKKISLLLTAALLAMSLAGCGKPVPPEEPSSMEEPPEPPVTEITATLAVGGDAMSHMPLTNDAYDAQSGEYDYGHVFSAVAPWLQNADYAVANLETTLSGAPYSGFPNFNSPDALAYGLKEAGIDLLSTANNHTKDKGYDGIFHTLDVLDEVGIEHVGTYRSQEERDANSGIVVADIGGISVAFLSYTYGLNGYSVSDDMRFCVNLFNLDYTTTLVEPDYDLLAADLAAAEALNTDLIAVIMHWGAEYLDGPTVHQKKVTDFMIAHGADLLLGGHPHVLEPYTTITVEDESGAEHTGFVCYSLGNLISAQNQEKTETTAILRLTLHKDLLTNETTLKDVDYVPCYMLDREEGCAGKRYYLLDTHAAMKAYEDGNRELITDGVYAALEKSLNHAHNIMGQEGDWYLRSVEENEGA